MRDNALNELNEMKSAYSGLQKKGVLRILWWGCERKDYLLIKINSLITYC